MGNFEYKGSLYEIIRLLHFYRFNKEACKKSVFKNTLIELGYIQAFDSDLEKLTNNNIVLIDHDNIIVTENGKKIIDDFFVNQESEIYEDILYSYEYALLKYFNTRNEFIKSNKLPDIHLQLAPISFESRINDGSLLDFIYSKRVLFDFHQTLIDTFKLSKVGILKLNILEKEKKEFEYKKGKELEQMQSVINTNTISSKGLKISVFLSALVIVIQIAELYKENIRDITIRESGKKDSLEKLEMKHTYHLIHNSLLKIDSSLQSIGNSIQKN